jgi:hypothetical protein
VIWGVLTWITLAVVLGVRPRRPDTRTAGGAGERGGFVVVVLSYVVLRVVMAVGGRVFL